MRPCFISQALMSLLDHLPFSDLGWDSSSGVRREIVSGSHPAYLQGTQCAVAFTGVIIPAQALSYSFNTWMLSVLHSCNCKSI